MNPGPPTPRIKDGSPAAGAATACPARSELLDARRVEAAIAGEEFWRLLGYPRDYSPGRHALGLAAAVRDWYRLMGRPWVYWREVRLDVTGTTVRLDDMEFPSSGLGEHLRRHAAVRAVVAAASAGAECDARASELWRAGKPDESYFVESFGSAVVEHLMAMVNHELCAAASRGGLLALPHFSPGYAGWDVSDQSRLFALIAGEPVRPGPLHVSAAGMTEPMKSMLALVAFAPPTADNAAAAARTPCERCGWPRCDYRRAPVRRARRSRPAQAAGDAAPLPS